MLFVALYPIWAFNDNNAVGRNKNTQAYRVVAFLEIRSIHLPKRFTRLRDCESIFFPLFSKEGLGEI